VLSLFAAFLQSDLNRGCPRARMPVAWTVRPCLRLGSDPVALTGVERDYEPLPFHIIVVDDRFGRRSWNQSVVVVLGELDLATAPRLADVLFAQIEVGKTDLVIDLVGVEFIDVTAMRTLLHVADRTSRLGGRLRLQAPSPPVRRVLDLLSLNGLLPIKE
jgi:anti-sigma B factor antagonist